MYQNLKKNGATTLIERSAVPLSSSEIREKLAYIPSSAEIREMLVHHASSSEHQRFTIRELQQPHALKYWSH